MADRNRFVKIDRPREMDYPPYEDFMSEYERGLVSLAIKNQDSLTEIQQKITVDYFLYPPHKVIFAALNSLVSNNNINSIDTESLLIECKALGLDQTGTPNDYLAILSQGGADRDNLDFYLEKVTNSYLKYSLAIKVVDSYKKILQNSQDSENNFSGEELIDNLNTEVSALQSFHGKETEAVSFADRVEEFVLERASNPQEVMGLKTGFPSLDAAINGLMPGTLTIIAGMAKAGKSTAMLNMVDYIAIESDDPRPILLISTEMYTDEDIARTIAMRCLIEERKIINGIAYNDPSLKPVLDKAIAQIQKSKIYHKYMPEFNAAKVCNMIYHYKLKHNIELAVFDYIKLSTMAGSSELADKREDQTLGEITTALKNIAGKLKIPVLTGCQINTRSGRIADSDRLIRYANTVIEFKPKTMEELQSHDFYTHGTHWLEVKTTRAGGNGKIPIRFWKKCLKLNEAEPIEESQEQVDNNIALLTTPTEYSDLKNNAYKISKVLEASQQVDASDMSIGEEENPNF